MCIKKILVIVTKLEWKVKKILLYWMYFEHFFTPWKESLLLEQMPKDLKLFLNLNFTFYDNLKIII